MFRALTFVKLKFIKRRPQDVKKSWDIFCWKSCQPFIDRFSQGS